MGKDVIRIKVLQRGLETEASCSFMGPTHRMSLYISERNGALAISKIMNKLRKAGVRGMRYEAVDSEDHVMLTGVI